MLGNSFGRLFRVTTAGASYSDAQVIVMDGVPSGLPLTEEDIQTDLDRRRTAQSPITTPRREADQVKIVAGTLNGHTTGAPVAMIIYSTDKKPFHMKQYLETRDILRPGHAEYTYHVKYGEYRDYRGGGRASGRVTVSAVAAGAIAKKILAAAGIRIIAYTKEFGGFRCPDMEFDDIVANVEANMIRCPDAATAEKMIARSLEVKEMGDTIGGIVEVIARGVSAGIGEPVYDKLSGRIAMALMNIGTVKGVEIGEGFGVAHTLGSEHNDTPHVEDGEVRFRTNRAGGILGGISNGEDIVARIAIKPTPTMAKEQPTVNMATGEPATHAAKTRYDVTVVPRVVPVAEAMVAMVLVDQMMMYRGWKTLVRE
jgi:chorismate synthase